MRDSDNKCFVVCYDEVGRDFWVSSKDFEEKDREYIGTMIFFDRKEAEIVAKRMNGE